MNARYPTPPRSPSSSEGSEDIHTLQPCTSEVTDVTEQEDVQVPPHERRDPPALSAPAIPTFEPVNMYDPTDPPAPSPIITTLEPIDMYELGDPPAPSAPVIPNWEQVRMPDPRDHPEPPVIPSIPNPEPAVIKNQQGDVLLGGYADFVIPSHVYARALKTAVKDKNPGRKLVTRLLHSVFSPTDLATRNATGKTTGKAPYPRLDPSALKALFAQARVQFPAFNDNCEDAMCATIQAVNNICKKCRQQVR